MDIRKIIVSGNRERVFINTAIGCEAQCHYCYLPNIGIEKIDNNIDKLDIIEEIEKREKMGEFIKGPSGTIVSFGCFTECWNKKTKDLTMQVLLYFFNKGNYIQIATKEYIEEKDIIFLCENLMYKNQLTINISLPVFYEAKQIEPNAEIVEKRIENFRYNEKYGIDIILYIKPVIENITIGNKDVYIKLIKQHKLKVVVGKYLHGKKIKNSEQQMVGDSEMWQIDSEQHSKLKNDLQKITNVYENSTQVIEDYRKQRNMR